MKRVWLLLLIIQLLHSLCLTAREYHFPKLEVTIWLQKDGTMKVQEDRSFSFKGSYSEGYRSFPTNGPARFSAFEVAEQSTPYTHSINREPGSMRIVEKQDTKELQWFYHATDTTRTFHIHFKVDGAIQRYEDVAVLYYQVISPEWEKAIENIRVKIVPPEGQPAREVKHWWHGSLDVISENQSDGTIVANLPRLPSNAYLEVRALYPQHLFASLPPLHGLAASDIMAEEATWTQEANRQREIAAHREAQRVKRHDTGRTLAFPISLCLIVGWIWLFMTYGRRQPTKDEPLQTKEPLPNEKPALINYLMFYETITADAMLATLFDLANRGILTITEKEKEKFLLSIGSKTDTWLEVDRKIWNKEKPDLMEFEQSLLAFLFDDLALGQNNLNLSVLQKKPTKTQTFFMKWKRLVKAAGRQKSWFDEYSRKGRTIGIAASMAAFVVGILLVVFFGPWMLFVAGISLIAVIASLAILHRTATGNQIFNQWQQVRNMLKRVHKKGIKKDTSKIILAQFIIYGVALGLGSYHMRRFLNQLDKDGHQAYLPWIILHSTSTRSYGDTIGQVITSTANTMSSATGAGGGGTMGGGGGAASGGGGAR